MGFYLGSLCPQKSRTDYSTRLFQRYNTLGSTVATCTDRTIGCIQLGASPTAAAGSLLHEDPPSLLLSLRCCPQGYDNAHPPPCAMYPTPVSSLCPKPGLTCWHSMLHIQMRCIPTPMLLRRRFRTGLQVTEPQQTHYHPCPCSRVVPR